MAHQRRTDPSDLPVRRSRLAARRRALGLSQQDMADMVGIDRSTIVRYERGETDPRPWYRPMLAEALHVTLDELADLIDPTDEETMADPLSRRHFLGITGLAGAALLA